MKGVPKTVVKQAIDKALDPLEEYLQKDGVTAWESILLELCLLIRQGLNITEEAGSPFEDK